MNKQIFKKLLNSQFKKNLVSGSVVHGLNILAVMVSYPIYINYLGFELFSVWALLSVVITFAMMGEFGIGKAIIAFTAKATAEENKEEIKRIISAASFIITIPSALILLFLYSFNEQLARLLNVPDEHLSMAIDIIPYIGIAIITYLVFDLLSALITGLGRLDITNILLLLLNLAKVGLTVLFLSLNYSLNSMVYGIFTANLLLIVVVVLILMIKFNLPLFSLTIRVRKQILELLNYGYTILGTQILAILTFPIIKIILSRSLGVESVGVFELASKVGYAIRTLFEKGLFAMMPEIARLHGISSKGDKNEAIYNKVRNMTRLLLLYAVPFFILIALLAPFWLKLWLNNNYQISILYGYWLLQPGILFGLMALPSYFSLMGTNNQRFCLYEAIIRTVLLLFMLYFFYLFSLQIGFAFLLISVSVIISNSYIILKFKTMFGKFESSML